MTSSEIQQNKEKLIKKNQKHPEGRCVLLTEMLHMMLRYPEVYTDLKFISISTMPFELRCLEKIDTNNKIEDGFYGNPILFYSRTKNTFLNEECILSMIR